MNILSIETSCDETAIAILKCSGGLSNPKFEIIANEVSSQIKIHRPFGGVVPNLAKREHIRNLPLILRKISNLQLPISNSQKKSKLKNLKLKTFNLKQVDCIAVTVGPGLEPALWTGINFAEDLAKTLNTERSPVPQRGIRAKKSKIPLIGVNHMEGHLYGFLLSEKAVISNDKPSTRAELGAGPVPHRNQVSGAGFQISKKMFPIIALVVSGGHTILLKMQSLTKWEKLGETVDDAAGEAFDKVARILGLQYPGGPEIEKLAKQGNPKAIAFPRPMLYSKNPAKAGARGAGYDFSFSGLKTSVLYYFRDHCTTSDVVQLRANIAASFQQAAIDVLTKKTMRAAEEFSARSIILCGGVACNKTLRETIKNESERRGLNFFVPEMKFNTDNAAMIAVAAYINILAKKSFGGLRTRKSLKIEADSNLNL